MRSERARADAFGMLSISVRKHARTSQVPPGAAERVGEREKVRKKEEKSETNR